MVLDEYGLETRRVDNTFNFIITQESDCSRDGGYSFEDATNIAELSRKEARVLVEELLLFIYSEK